MNVPKLRFKEFNDEWIETKIQNVATVIGGGTPSTDEPKYWGNEINWFTPSEIGKTKYVTISNRKISQDGLNNSSAKLLPKGTILLSSRATVGEASILLNEASTNQGFQSLIVNENNCNEFIYYLKYKYKREMLIKSFGSTFLEISKSNVENIKIKIPSKEEQFMIANFLSLLDKKIELQSKKIEDLKLFKLELKERLFKMFETDQKDLGDILIKWNKKNKDNIYNYVESVSNKYGFIAQNEQFEDRTIASNDTKNYYVIEKGVFAYNPSRLNVGSLALKENDKVSLVSPLYECFTTNQNNNFLYEWFNSKEFKKGTISKFEGGVRNTLNFTNLCKIKINLPSLENQNKISNLLNLYNNLINLENMKLSKLNTLKTGLMQNMFV